MRYLSRCICLPALLASALSQGATPYEGDLPIELARYFTGGGFWYSDLPDDFPPFTLPANLQVLGSLDQGQRKQVILTTTIVERDTSLEALAEAFLAQDGWTREATPSEAALKPKGFVTQAQLAAQPSIPIRLCHDSYGSMQIDPRFAPDVIYLSSGSSSPRSNGPDCLQRRDMEQQMVARSNSIVLQNLPVLELPADTSIPGNRILNDGPIPQNEFETGLRITAEDQSLKRLNRNFTRQMRRQGWKRDKQWAGDLSAGSSWTLQTDDDRELSALINIVHVTETDYELSLRLLELL